MLISIAESNTASDQEIILGGGGGTPAAAIGAQAQQENPLDLLCKAIEQIESTQRTLFNCNSCENSYTNVSNLNRHIRTKHSNRNEIKCEHCTSVFNREDHYLRHKRDVHSNKKYTCLTCNRRFKSKNYLNGHMKRHDLTQRFSCPWLECEKSYADTKTLKGHCVRNHLNGIRPYQCNCGKKYKARSSLQRHIKNNRGHLALSTAGVMPKLPELQALAANQNTI